MMLDWLIAFAARLLLGSVIITTCFNYECCNGICSPEVIEKIKTRVCFYRDAGKAIQF